MPGGEQSGLPSLTRTNIATPVSSPIDEGMPPNGSELRVHGSGAPDECTPDRARVGLPSSVIHEMRTPLTSVHGYAQVLQRMMQDEPRAANALAVVLRETTRLSSMLGELSELADLEAGDVVAAPIEVDAQQIVDGVVHEISRRDAGAHPIELNGSATARCNPSILSQVLLHVLTNAVRFSEPGSPVDVFVRPRGDKTEIVVGDRGISIDPADARRIYEPFERGANARKAGVRGLGLGLYLARRALERVGGSIDHAARDGGGTRFRITVPGVRGVVRSA
jgi:signal transduction histidine kinase